MSRSVKGNLKSLNKEDKGMKKLIYHAVFFMLMVGLVIIAWTPELTLSQTPPGEIRVGLNFTMSGPAAPWGITYSRTIKAYIEEINKEGGLLIGGKRYQIKTFEYDNKRDPATSVENAKKLIFTDKVHAIMHNGAVCVTPTLPILSENKIMSMDISVGPEVLRWPYNFNILPAGRNWSLMSYNGYLKQWPGIKKVAEINPDNDSGYTTEVDDRLAVKKLGLEIISHQFFTEDTTDFYPILTKAIAAKPDIIVIGMGSPGHVPVILKQTRELGWKGPIGMTQGSFGAVSTVLKIAGEAAEGFVNTHPIHVDRNYLSKQENEWMDYCLKRWGEPFVGDTYLSCKQFNLWVQGVKKADSLDPDKIAKALETNKFAVQGWKIHFVATPDTYMGRPRSLILPFALQTFKGGKISVLDLILPEGVERAE
jgi:ABC-type branched-subunit amino acid transport system substrate-binding protein